jgi:hypothetical protein
MTNANDSSTTRELGRRVAADGVGPHREALDALARTALALGLRCEAAHVLLDPTAPEIVHQRALGVVSSALADWSAHHTEPVVLVA